MFTLMRCLLVIYFLVPVYYINADKIDPQIWSSKKSVVLDAKRVEIFNYILAEYDFFYNKKFYKLDPRHKKHFEQTKKHCHLKKILIHDVESYSHGKTYWRGAGKAKYLRKPPCYRLIKEIYEWLQAMNEPIIYESSGSDSEPVDQETDSFPTQR